MEKIIKIGNKEVKLKANAMQAVIYRASFGRDMIEVQSSLLKLIKTGSDGRVSFDLDGLKDIDSLGVVQMIWTMARAADESTPPLEQWLDRFDVFPIVDVLIDSYELLLANFVGLTKIKNTRAAGSSQRKA